MAEDEAKLQEAIAAKRRAAAKAAQHQIQPTMPIQQPLVGQQAVQPANVGG